VSDEEQKARDEVVVLDAYSRAQAIVDGVLVDVTDTAKRVGIKAPVALTRAVWDRYVELTPAAEKAGNDKDGRLWDVLWMFRGTALQNRSTDEFRYALYVVTDSIKPSLVELKAIIGRGDDGETVITILLPEED
jgi:hypothetical protein